MEIARPQSGSSSGLIPSRIGIWKCWLIFEEGGKAEYTEKNLSEQRREPTTNSTHIWRRRQDLNPGHIGSREASTLTTTPSLASQNQKLLTVDDY